MIDAAGGWALDVDRGPGWLFVRLNSAPEGWWQAPPLAECMWALLRQQFVDRVVLECDELSTLTSELIRELVTLQERIESHGGMMRLCGLSPGNQQILADCPFAERLATYGDREEAVMGSRPKQPR